MGRDGLALPSADRTAGGKFMRVIRRVESESEVREAELGGGWYNENCGFCCGQMGRWEDGKMWMDYRGRDGDVGQDVGVERGRAVQRSHRAET